MNGLAGMRVLKPKGDPVQFQLVGQALLIGGFQQSRTKLAMNFNRTPNHPLRSLVEFHPSCPFVLFVVKSVRHPWANQPIALVVPGPAANSGCFGCGKD